MMNKLRPIGFTVLIAAAVSIILPAGCGRKTVDVPEFSGERAYSYIDRQISFGPRVPGTESNLNCRNYLIAFFDSLGARIDTMVFIHNDKTTGQPVKMVNIIASFDGLESAKAARYLVGAHYDTRPRAEYDPDSTKRMEWIDGANDGASGVALLMELGNMFSKQRPRVNIDLVMFDGEDYGPPGRLDEYFLGAKEMVRRKATKEYEFALVIDMIGEKDLKVYREEFSNKYSPNVVNWIWGIAAELGESVFIDSVGYAVHDDHLSFMTVKLPAAVIIDFNYRYWHTTHDTIDKCSPESLKSVGRVVATALYRL